MARRRLIDIELSRGSRLVRNALFWLMTDCGAVATLTYVIPSHRTYDESELHSGYADAGYVPLVGLASVTVLLWWLSRQRFGAGMIASFVAGVASLLEFARAAFVHLLTNVADSPPEVIHFVVLIGMFGAAVLMFFIEPVLYIVERSSQERAERTIPTARVVNT